MLWKSNTFTIIKREESGLSLNKQAMKLRTITAISRPPQVKDITQKINLKR